MTEPGVGFTVTATDGWARAGELQTAHGPMATPGFMAVGTAGTVKGLTPDQLAATGTQTVLGNTYHLMLRPGAERVARLGGLHSFMNWPGPILTDSGGFQVMSLSQLRQLDEGGVTFQSHIDGAKHRLTPESCMEIQHQLDSDIAMVLDECPAYPCSRDTAAESMALSLRWAERCREAFTPRAGYGLFGIVQGSVYAELRRSCAQNLAAMGFDGYAIGGLAVGEGQDQMLATLAATTPALPEERPRYLMGVGKPADLVEAVARGCDMFDCVLPTRSGRTGQAWTWAGAINLNNARHRDDPRPLAPAIDCPASRDFSRGYLAHLVRSNEMLGPILLTWHNLAFYQTLMAEMRAAIAQGRFAAFRTAFYDRLAQGDDGPDAGAPS